MPVCLLFAIAFTEKSNDPGFIKLRISIYLEMDKKLLNGILCCEDEDSKMVVNRVKMILDHNWWHSSKENREYSACKSSSDCQRTCRSWDMNSKQKHSCDEKTHGSFTMAIRLSNSTVFCQKSDGCSPPAILLPRPGPLRYFLFPKLRERRSDTTDDIKTRVC